MAVLELLGDEYVRSILTVTNVESLSASELSERCDASLATVCRRLERLQDAGLVAERTRPRADGHHDTVYAATLEELSVRLTGDELAVELRRRDEDAADRLTRMWEDL